MVMAQFSNMPRRVQPILQANQAVGEANQGMVGTDFLVQETTVIISKAEREIQVLVGIGLHGTSSHYVVMEMELVHIDPRPKGSEFVNFMKADTARREHHVVIGTHDILDPHLHFSIGNCVHLILQSQFVSATPACPLAIVLI
jgi:hypothetical protein